MNRFTIWLTASVVLYINISYGHGSIHEILVKLNQSIVASPNNTELLLSRANMLLQHGDLKEAMSDLKRVEALSPEKVERHYLLAKIHIEQKQFFAAIKALDTCIEQQAKNVKAYRLRSQAHHSSGDFENAVKDAWTAIELHPLAPVDYHSEYISLLIAQQRIGEAKEAFSLAEASLGQLPTLLMMKAQALAKWGELDKAAATYAKIRSSHPMLAFNCWQLEAKMWRLYDKEKSLRALGFAKESWHSLPARQRSALKPKYALVVELEASMQNSTN
ncbi:MAG: tetratricopeptide repeat protein [Opitutaceae bacterium]